MDIGGVLTERAHSGSSMTPSSFNESFSEQFDDEDDSNDSKELKKKKNSNNNDVDSAGEGCATTMTRLTAEDVANASFTTIDLNASHIVEGEEMMRLGVRARKAEKVLECLKVVLHRPPDAGPVGPTLKLLSEDDLDWLAPLLIAAEKTDVTEILLHLAAGVSPRLRLRLISLHACGFSGSCFARASVNSLFDISKLERNTLSMMEFVAQQRQHLEVGQPVAYEAVHPFSCSQVASSFVVRKVFDTTSKPLLIEMLDSSGSVIPPALLAKDRDDMRIDLQVQSMFRVFNELWELHGDLFLYGQLPYAKTYRVAPFSSTSGVLEIVPRCTPLAKHSWSVADIDKHRTVSSAVGAFVAGYVLGVRDRHEDNLLFSQETLELFHVDFGFIFNSQTKMFDAPRFAIPSNFKVCNLGNCMLIFIYLFFIY